MLPRFIALALPLSTIISTVFLAAPESFLGKFGSSNKNHCQIAGEPTGEGKVEALVGITTYKSTTSLENTLTKENTEKMVELLETRDDEILDAVKKITSVKGQEINIVEIQIRNGSGESPG